MGRLTLNVLLSFAQFEREVTGERILDKIAASKARGMWMGGNLPLGYDLSNDGARRLVVNAGEAETVRGIFRRYLELGSVHDLARNLESRGIRSKPRVRKDGSIIAGKAFSRGALFHLLRNPVYLGLIRHKDARHDGLHDAIVDRGLFDAVQERLDAGPRRNSGGSRAARSRGRLTGRIFDATGERMSPTFAIGARGKRYRYYVSASLQQGRRSSEDGVLRRVPAEILEQALIDRLSRINGIDPEAPMTEVRRIDVFVDHVWITLPKSSEKNVLATLAADEELASDAADPNAARLRMPITFPKRGGATAVELGPDEGPQPDKALIKALRAAHAMLSKDGTGQPTLHESPTSPYQRRLIRLAFLAPDLQVAILTGRQPRDLTLARLLAPDFPIDWEYQRQRFGRPRRDC